jgi:predicted secreted protein
MGAQNGFGTILALADVATGLTFTDVANVTNITPFNITRETDDTTDMASADGYRTFLGGLKDSGECTIDVNYNPSDHNTLLSRFDAEDPTKHRITFPGGEIASFDAIMTGFAPTAPMEGKMTASLGFKISGKIAWT